jgi:Adenylosuccinate lyase
VTSWGYVSLGYFKTKAARGRGRSSTCRTRSTRSTSRTPKATWAWPTLLKHLSEKLPISRWQRDLTDSTVLRNMGVAMGYAVLAYNALLTGLGKLEINETAIAADLDASWEVLAEPIQTVMRRFGLLQPYEQLKKFTRGEPMTRELMQGFIAKLEIPAAEKARLLAMTPGSYTGKAAELARRV